MAFFVMFVRVVAPVVVFAHVKVGRGGSVVVGSRGGVMQFSGVAPEI